MNYLNYLKKINNEIYYLKDDNFSISLSLLNSILDEVSDVVQD